eukprot:6191008-Pleurochrysis_carterae.AAC.2
MKRSTLSTARYRRSAYTSEDSLELEEEQKTLTFPRTSVAFAPSTRDAPASATRALRQKTWVGRNTMLGRAAVGG